MQQSVKQKLSALTAAGVDPAEAEVILREQVKWLTPREQYCFVSYYALCGSRQLSARELGRKFNVSHERVIQLIQRSRMLVQDYCLTQTITSQNAEGSEFPEVFTYARGAMAGVRRNVVTRIRSFVSLDDVRDPGTDVVRVVPMTMPRLLDMTYDEVEHMQAVSKTSADGVVKMLATLGLALKAPDSG